MPTFPPGLPFEQKGVPETTNVLRPLMQYPNPSDILRSLRMAEQCLFSFVVLVAWIMVFRSTIGLMLEHPLISQIISWAWLAYAYPLALTCTRGEIATDIVKIRTTKFILFPRTKVELHWSLNNDYLYVSLTPKRTNNTGAYPIQYHRIVTFNVTWQMSNESCSISCVYVSFKRG